MLTVLVLLSDVLLETDLFILPLNTGLSYYYQYARPQIRHLLERYVSTSQPIIQLDSHDEEQEELYEVYPSNEYFSEKRYVSGLREGSDYNAYYPQLPSPTQGEGSLYFHLPQYVKTSLLFVGGMTLFLFFASGTYSEKVGYANK